MTYSFDRTLVFLNWMRVSRTSDWSAFRVSLISEHRGRALFRSFARYFGIALIDMVLGEGKAQTWRLPCTLVFELAYGEGFEYAAQLLGRVVVHKSDTQEPARFFQSQPLG